MPNENLPVCACGIVVDLPKSRSSSIVLEKLTTLLPKSKSNKRESKDSRKQQDDRRGLKTRTSSETGNSSLVTEATKPTMKNNKHEKRLNHSRRTRSADNAESHYTYIDSSSSVLSDRIRENTAIPEVLYTGIPDRTNANTEEIRTNRSNMQNRSQAFYTAIPSMTSPPPTYDVAIAKARQTGLPPTYEEYLYHKYAISRSHTPPPPWSDSTTTSSSILSSNPTSSLQTHRDLLLSQPELREYLAQLTLDSHYQHQHQQHQQQHRQQSRDAICSALREQQIRAHHRARAMPPRSQSESRAQQQRIAAMYEDAAFCMETTVLQSAFDSGQGFGLCSLM